jgi:hypothetical protein
MSAHRDALNQISYLRLNKYLVLDFNITYPGKGIFQIPKSSAILVHCLDEIFCVQV